MEHGIVTATYYEQGAVACDVQGMRVDSQYRQLPVIPVFAGMIHVPRQGDKVAIHQFEDGTRFIKGVIESRRSYPDEVSEGEFVIQLDQDTKLSFTQTDSGDYDIKINASGDLNLDATGEINVSTDGEQDVNINGIPFENHVHSYTDDEISDTSDGTGTETTQNKTTDPPQ